MMVDSIVSDSAVRNAPDGDIVYEEYAQARRGRAEDDEALMERRRKREADAAARASVNPTTVRFTTADHLLLYALSEHLGGKLGLGKPMPHSDVLRIALRRLADAENVSA